jgi:hypothetical protein
VEGDQAIYRDGGQRDKTIEGARYSKVERAIHSLNLNVLHSDPQPPHSEYLDDRTSLSTPAATSTP